MKASLRQLARKVLDFGSGEAVSRLCGVVTLLFLAHRYGVLFVGVYALAQSMLGYSYPIIDFGLRHVGARLVAQYPQAAREIVGQVQRRRLMMAGVLLPFLLIYAASTKLPTEAKIFLFVFAAIGSLYAVSLDWMAWGRENMRLVSFGRAVVPVSILVCLLLSRNSGRVLWLLVLGNAIGNGLQAAIFWIWWKKRTPAPKEPIPLAMIRESLAWRRTSVMGLAWLCNFAFNTIDMLMLGIMSNTQQVGLYSAAYRVVNQVLCTYYLVTIVLYPQLARQDRDQRVRMLRPGILFSLLGAGAAMAAVLTVSRRPVLTILFGHQFLMAAPLLLLLAWAIPFDFLTSYLGNAYIAWGMEKKILLCTVVAAGSNIVLNLIWIPSYGATAAAVNTLISYGIFLAGLALAGRFAKELAGVPQVQTELIAQDF
jgi:O-antigen/teichoic acid export membrane protein